MKDLKMRRILGLMLLMVFLTSVKSFGYISGIAIQSDETSNMSVYINGKLYNKHPGSFVRIKSMPGLFHLQVKVLNPYDKVWYIVRKDINVEKGFELFYKVVFARGKRPQIQATKKYPVYSKYFLNPTLYNKYPIT
jgi:hypothetical protein